jgi:ADP-ribose pyrophosphatase YjhB (NUDIX family)
VERYIELSRSLRLHLRDLAQDRVAVVLQRLGGDEQPLGRLLRRLDAWGIELDTPLLPHSEKHAALFELVRYHSPLDAARALYGVVAVLHREQFPPKALNLETSVPHLHPQGIDLCVSMFVVYRQQVLLIHHKKLATWLPPGGHVEHAGPAGEDTNQALFRELKEETGLTAADVTLWQVAAKVGRHVLGPEALQRSHNTQQLLVPWRVDRHDFPPVPGHQHLALIYLLRAYSSRVQLETTAHHAIKWFVREELFAAEYQLLPTIAHYGVDAIEEAGW